MTQAPELTDTLEILFSGFAIGGSATDQDTGTGPCTVDRAEYAGIVTSHLVLRSLIGLMAAAAQEQAFYDILAKSGTDPESPSEKTTWLQRIHDGLLTAQGLDPNITSRTILTTWRSHRRCKASIPFSQLVPPIERLPVLRLTWPSEVKPPVSSLCCLCQGLWP